MMPFLCILKYKVFTYYCAYGENKPDQERDTPTTRTKEHRNKDIER